MVSGDEQRRKRLPCEWRLCRFFKAEVKTEAHAVLACSGSPALCGLRSVFWADLCTGHWKVWRTLVDGGYYGKDDDTLMVLIASEGLHRRLARLVFDVFAVYAAALMFIPAPELFDKFPDLADEVLDGTDSGL